MWILMNKDGLYLTAFGWSEYARFAVKFLPTQAEQALKMSPNLTALRVDVPSENLAVDTRQSGFALLIEMMIVCMVMLVLAAAAVPNLVRIGAASNQSDAKIRVLQVLQGETAELICAENPPASGCPALPMLPAPGSVGQLGYTFVFSQTGSSWTYTATPQRVNFTGIFGYYTDQTGVLRCAVGTASASSPACQ